MTHRERVLETFRFGQVDRPAFDLAEGTVWRELLSYFSRMHGLRSQDDVFEFLDTDFRWVRMRDLEPESNASISSAAAGDHGEYSKRVAIGPLKAAKSPSEVLAWNWPDPARWQAPNCAEARSMWPDHAIVFMPGWKPLFWAACEAFGFEEALIKMVHESRVFEAFIRRQHEFYTDILERGLNAADGFCDICWLGDDFASQRAMMLSPEHWRRFIRPYLAKQVQLARSHGMFVLYHSCGAVRPILSDLVDIGVNGLVVFQTTAKNMDAASIAREFGGKLVFYGGVDVQHLLSFGSTEEVKSVVWTNLDAFAPTGGYVVANCHHRVATIRGENVEAMSAAARAWRQS